MEKNISMTDTMARSLYPTASPEFKTMLEANFGGKAFFVVKITDRVKTFEDACVELGVDPKKVFTDDDLSDEVAYKQLKVVARALNEGWIPDWDNRNQYKYYPWFDMEGGFRLLGVDGNCTDSTVGSRLCFKSRELAEYAAKQFAPLYKSFMTI